MLNRNSLVGMGMFIFIYRRFASNITNLEKNTQEKKLFDPIKAKAQIQVYKDIYSLDEAGK